MPPKLDKPALEPQEGADLAQGPDIPTKDATPQEALPGEPYPMMEPVAVWDVPADSPTPAAVRCDLLSSGYFPAGDPRAGEYHPGRVYVVGMHITADQAVALLEGDGFSPAQPE